MHSNHARNARNARNALAILSRVRPYGVRFNSTKPPKYVQSRPPQDPSTKIPDPRIVPPDHGEPAGPFPSTLLYENHPPATPATVKAMEDARSRPSSSSTTPAHPFTTRALADEEAGTDVGRGGYKASTGWQEQGYGGEGRGVVKDESGVGWSAAVRYRGAPGMMEEGSEGGLGLRGSKGKKDV
jgi:hypothetical protein